MIRDQENATPPDKAEEILRAYTFEPKSELIDLREAHGRVLFQPAVCPRDSPPFSKSAMDGYAVRSADSGKSFSIMGTLAAGDAPKFAPERGECVKIMTGAPMPQGTDKVVRVEYTREEAGRMILLQPEPADNVILQGSNHRQGEVFMRPKRLTPRDIGILASYGFDRVSVALPPKVAIIPTGTELQVPGRSLQPGQIYNSNGFQLGAQTAETGCPCRIFDIVNDESAALEKTLRLAMEQSDVVLLSGGVSMGDYDYVPDGIRKIGADIILHGLAVKPGKPTLFAVKDSTYIFGMPGNPVSTFVIFEVFVKPFLFRMMGIEYRPTVVRGTLTETLRRRFADRVEFRPVTITEDKIHILPYHGSANLDALGEANALLRIEQGEHECPKGEERDVRLL
ncbi:MAG: molybdopterin molybdotransferase MoeA [Spirochaetales bacterium]|nr:molybdopterin molybdotransferase MoeA [Spirochaetales bacterium]